MKMKNREIIEHVSGLASFTKDKVPSKLSFAIVKNFNKLKALGGDFDEARLKLLDEYNIKDENGEPAYKTTGMVEIAKECAEVWEKEVNELLEIEVDVDIHMVDFAVIENLELSVDDISVIEFMIQ